MLCNERLAPGKFIHIVGKEEEYGKSIKRLKKYRVIKHYRHWVLVEDAFGQRRGPTNAELMQNGIVTQRMVETP